ncbi:ABC-type uncharacterized transport system periplasmic component-like protein [Candidatus Vecturithrix granuli]|uniref:ABC-type uncharacterized transport system periplasmic component-like protein n=1 Tax=Vecturithrix granuli TaxID=1499967 RepID=A0A0S6WCQ1_VECG1|nr:ABC-type uncharacterized transport system periplasmic component-like protein [Candidatus Vecturithrix granuli]
MFQMRVCRLIVGMVAVLCVAGFMLQPATAARYKVLVVMSYDETYPFEAEMREGIEAALAEMCEMTYFYMNTKKHFEGGPQKAKEAYALYHELQPDGVIAADDDAQAMFVVPYLKDQLKTPVMFCGVNAEPEKYGYPASNVSGILERGHDRESLALLLQLAPSVKTFGRIVKDTPMSRADVKTVQQDVEAAGLTYIDFNLPATLQEALDLVETYRERCDVLLVSTLQGIPDENGNPMTNRAAIARVVTAFGKPTIGSTLSDVRDGALCAVIQSGQEQGHTAAEMLLKALKGSPVPEIPITRNKFGRRIINVDTMKALSISPKPLVIRNAELVKTEP